jgi:hypothetical protein
MKNIIKNNIKMMIFIIICIYCLIFDLHIFNWNKSPIYLPKETKKISISATDESLESSIIIQAKNDVKIVLRNEQGEKYIPITKKDKQETVYEFYVLRGDKFILSSTNLQKRVIIREIEMKDLTWRLL